MNRVELVPVLAIKGYGRADHLAEAFAAPVETLTAHLAALEAEGLASASRLGYRLTEAGKAAAEARRVEEASAFPRAVMEALYARFEPLNHDFKAAIADWQMRRVDGVPTPNDHSDAAYDAAVLGRVRALHPGMLALIADCGHYCPRLSLYGVRLERALARVAAGELRHLTAPIIDSYHTVWFEWHEDLIRLSGRTRAAEAAAGRAV